MAVELTPNGTYGASLSSGTLATRVLPHFGGLLIGLYRLLRGRGMRAQGAPLLLLTTIGARSNKVRTTPVAWFPDGSEAWLVVASAAGSARHPAYHVNMARQPDQVWIEVGHRKVKVDAESLTGARRADAWRRIVSQSPGYQAYQDKTDRQIPVIRLTPATGVRVEGPQSNTCGGHPDPPHPPAQSPHPLRSPCCRLAPTIVGLTRRRLLWPLRQPSRLPKLDAVA